MGRDSPVEVPTFQLERHRPDQDAIAIGQKPGISRSLGASIALTPPTRAPPANRETRATILCHTQGRAESMARVLQELRGGMDPDQIGHGSSDTARVRAAMA
jgi:hypothetical protein